MATVQTHHDRLLIGFDAGERRWLRRAELSVPLAAIRRAEAVSKPLRLARGARVGYEITGLAKVGVWGVFGGPRQLVSARRNRPGLHLVLDRSRTGDDLDEVILSVPAATALVAELTRRRAA